MMNRNKKSQEEMIGFVLIIVLVAVIALVFLAIQIRKPPEMETSYEVGSFLYSTMLYTTDCRTSPERVRSIENLINDCYRGKECLDGTDTCDALNNTVSRIVEKEYPLNKHKGYRFRVYRGNETSIFNLEKGNSTGKMAGRTIPISSDIDVEFKIFESIQS